MDKAIGGYFELELPQKEEYHKNALRLNSGKNCLEYILKGRKYKKVYIPYYTCDVVLKPFVKLGITYQFYHINLQFEIAERIILHEGEALLYTNYYGLKQKYIYQLTTTYGNRLIIDNTQAFYAQPIEGIDTFYTCRKFFGVSDGAYLYTDIEPINGLQKSTSFNRIMHLIKRIDISPEAGFDDFHQADASLAEENIMQMSCFTKRMMQSIDYNKVAKQRRENFIQLDKALANSNELHLYLEEDSVPMVYPYLTERKRLRGYLILNKIFVATYWPNVLEWCIPNDWEFKLVNNIICIPIDQRYGEDDMKKIINVINTY